LLKSQSVHPAAAGAILVVAIIIIWFLYASVFSGKISGSVGAPGGLSGKK